MAVRNYSQATDWTSTVKQIYNGIHCIARYNNKEIKQFNWEKRTNFMSLFQNNFKKIYERQ